MTMIKDFFKAHGHGFWLHCLGSVGVMAIGWSLERWAVLPDMLDWWINWLIVAVAINTPLWPIREKVQKGKNAPWSAILTFHVLLEWVPAIVVGWIIFLVLMN